MKTASILLALLTAASLAHAQPEEAVETPLPPAHEVLPNLEERPDPAAAATATTSPPAASATAGPSVPACPPVPPPPEAPLRPRRHMLSFRLSSSTTKLNVTTDLTRSKSEITTSESSYSYGYEFGSFQPFFSGSSQITTAGTAKETASTFSLGLRFNFIPNRPGRDLIPYAYVEAAGLSSDIDNGATLTALTGSGAAFAVGLEWYPLSEIFAIRFEYAAGQINMTGRSGTQGVLGDGSSRGLTVGYVFAF